MKMRQRKARYWRRLFARLDNCEVCKGWRGGVRGNENRVDGVVMCDACTSDHQRPGLVATAGEFLGCEAPLPDCMNPDLCATLGACIGMSRSAIAERELAASLAKGLREVGEHAEGKLALKETMVQGPHVEGDKSIAVCHECREVVDTTLKRRDVPFSDGSGVVRDILAAVCDVCGSVVAIPACSAPTIKAAREAQAKPAS
jgi:hypothetical protein